MSNRALETALEALRHGIAPLPVAANGLKRPALPKWEHLCEELPSEDWVRSTFARDDVGVGFVMAGELECIDFDDRATFDAFAQRAEEFGIGELFARVLHGFSEETPNGVHIIYRCEAAEGSKKLAKGKDKKCLIETRGTNSYVIKSGSPLSTHPSGKPYLRMHGGPAEMARISEDEREALFTCARSFGYQAPAVESVRQSLPSTEWDSRPGDDFNRNGDWENVLGGWRRLRNVGPNVHWERPGKRMGATSATVRNIDGVDVLYVFSTSTDLEALRGYTKFQAFAQLHHGGDFKAAAKELAEAGFGKERPHLVDVSQLTFEPKPEEKPKDAFPQHLLDVPGLLGSLSDHINKSASSPQPILSLAASIAAVSCIIGRKVCGPTGLQSNLYLLALAPQGSGKEHARRVIKRLFQEAGVFRRVSHDKLASEAAIWSALEQEPSLLFMLDEFGRTIAQIASDKAPGHIRAQADALLTLYSQSNQMASSKSYADADRKVDIWRPNLSIYGTTVPHLFYDAMSSDDVASGFLSRFMVFESEGYADLVTPERSAESVPEELLNTMLAWERTEMLSRGNVDKYPSPRVVPATPAAQAVMRDLTSDMRKLSIAQYEAGKPVGGQTRVAENTWKLALVRACGQSAMMPEIKEADAEWAAQLSLHLFNAFDAAIEERTGRTEHERRVKLVAAFVRAKGKVSARDLNRKFQQFTARERGELITSLEDSGHVLTVAERTGQRGPAKKSLVWVRDT